MPVITDITAQKRQTDVYNIIVDGKFVCGLGALELSSAGLKVGLELTHDDLTRLVAQSQGAKAFNMALRYLSYRPRSEFEVMVYLRRKDYSDDLIEITMARLRDNKFVDDTAFAESWVRSRQAGSPRSVRVLRMELMKKRIAKDVIDGVLSEQDAGMEFESLRVVAAKKLRLTRFSQDKQKLIQYLVGQGYRYGDVKQVLDELVAQDYKANDHTSHC